MNNNMIEQMFVSLQNFSNNLTDKFSVPTSGQDEDQLKPAINQLLIDFSSITRNNIISKGETPLVDNIGRPDFTIHLDTLPIGYIELKAPGKGANTKLYKGHDKEQWLRFCALPNILYTDGNEWALYRSGERIGNLLRFTGDIRTDRKNAVNRENAKALFEMLSKFIQWTPVIPKKPKLLAEFLAPYCRLLRDEIIESLQKKDSSLQKIKSELKDILFPEADDAHFADSYAQTITFALLLSRLDGANVLNLQSACDALESDHSLLSNVLKYLTLQKAFKEIEFSLLLIQRIINEIAPDILKAKDNESDPWLFFYEHFLAKYDPDIRKRAGAYYTPIEVVNCQVRLVDEVLREQFNKPMGFNESGVTTLDPAVGTGTYLLSIIDYSLKRAKEKEGIGAIPANARLLAQNLHGFEWMVGPYAVAQLRVSREIISRGSTLPPDGFGIYLTNTLESPYIIPPAPSLFSQPIAQENERAKSIKDAKNVLVCIGNPPYKRLEAELSSNYAYTGGWVRYGHAEDLNPPLLNDFIKPAKNAGMGKHLKNLYNQYICFMRWALWKVFEHRSAAGPGVISFITASSYLNGDAFVGVREHLRRHTDTIYIIDLGGEGRGTRPDENVFDDIQTPVAIIMAWRKAKRCLDKPAEVFYTRVEGTRIEKLATLNAVKSREDFSWVIPDKGWQTPFTPALKNSGHLYNYYSFPQVSDVFPWQNNGVQFKRTWPIAPTTELLEKRWKLLVESDAIEKAQLFKESSDRKISGIYKDINTGVNLTNIKSATIDDLIKPIRYTYRTLDRQWAFPDARLCSRMRPSLWHVHSEHQIYLISIFKHPLGQGPAITVSSSLPDLHCFRGSFGGKDVIPLYRDPHGKKPNIHPELLPMLSKFWESTITAEDVAGYVYAVLAQPTYSSLFHVELGSCQIRVPFTKDYELFKEASAFGKKLIWLHTYAERFNANGRGNSIPKGKARYIKAISETEYPEKCSYDRDTQTLIVGDGKFQPVSPDVYEFSVSGMPVVQSWLGYRMKVKSGKKTSKLDYIHPASWADMYKELLELLWVLEKTIDGYPEQSSLLEAILSSPLFKNTDINELDRNHYCRKEPAVPSVIVNELSLFTDR